MASGRVEGLLEWLAAERSFRDEIVSVRTLPPREARRREIPPAIDPRLADHLRRNGIGELYLHQAEAVEKVLEGRNVVVVTSTASGKTICYNLPVLNSVLQGDGGYSIYLFPTKALAQDQMRVLSGFISGLDLEVEAGVYDGDTEPVVRRKLRRNGRIIITNPDMLHAAILPHHGGWAGLFSRLKYVIVDEIHSLRGIFGSNTANVIRRLRRIAAHYGSSPRFIATSATIANPREHAERLFGLPFEVVDEDGSPQGEKTFVLWNPPMVERPDGMKIRKGAPSVASRLLPEFLRRGVKTICFGRARSTVELLLRYILDRLGGNPSLRALRDRIESYRGGYLPSERRDIERRLFSGDLLAVVSTNALELGIDIGDLDACILAGYPGTVASFHQQAGRAGRRTERSLVLFVASGEPLDQYFMRHPASIFESSVESAIIEYDNPYILTKHLICAAYELPLGPEDGDLFGPTFAAAARVLEDAGKFRRTGDRWYYIEEGYPAQGVKLRTVEDENFTIHDISADRVVGELDYVAGLLSLYEGAVYMHRSETHVVEVLDVKNQIAHIRQEDTGYYTQALCQKSVRVNEEIESAPWRISRVSIGDVTVRTQITGYKKVRFHTLENVGYGEVKLPALELDTVSLYLDLPVDAAERAMAHGPDFFQSAMHGAARVLTNILPLFVMGDPQDIDYFIEGRRVYVYDLYPGGIGYAEKAYEIFERVVEATLDLVRECSCSAGCPGCVLPGASRYETYMEPSILEYPFPREATRYLLHLLLEKEPYTPRLEPVALPGPARPPEPQDEIDPRTMRRIERAARRLKQR